MNDKKFRDLTEELYDTNNFLEMCRGYAQSDTPNMQALAESLYILQDKYEGIYGKLCCIEEHAPKKAGVER